MPESDRLLGAGPPAGRALRRETPRAVVIDASPYVFRAWFSLPSAIVGREGQPLNAVYGFAEFLRRLLLEARPRHAAVAFDGSFGTGLRNGWYPAYKANREPAPDELRTQFRHCRRVARALGLATFASRRYEADDLIAALVRRLRRWQLPVAIVTPDKDLAQLVGRGDLLWDYARDRRLDAGAVGERFGVAPGAIADLLALTGDPVDNIPGVPGIGRATAVRLLRRFGDLDTVYRRIGEIDGAEFRGAQALAGRLRRHRAQAMLSRRLARLHPPPLRCTPRDLEWKGVRPGSLERLLRELGLGGTLARRCARLESPRRRPGRERDWERGE